MDDSLIRAVTNYEYMFLKSALCRNYYVFETNKQQEDDHTEAEEETKHTEFGRPVESIPQEKEGTNVYAYWVCSRPGEAFIQLPDVTPLQIQTARSLKKFLTGNLNVLTSKVVNTHNVEQMILHD